MTDPAVNQLRLKTYQDIANFFGVSRMTLFRWLKLKPFPKSWVSTYYCHDNHRLKVDSKLIMDWLKDLETENPHSKARYVWKSIIKTRSVT